MILVPAERGCGKQIGLVRANALLEYEGGVDHRGEKQRLAAMLGIVGIDARDMAQIEDAAGGGAVQ